jgi:hypothetical protein
VSPDGTRVFVTGSYDGGIAFVYGTVAYDASSGAKVWAARYNGPGNGNSALSLRVSPEGSRVFVTGYSAGSGDRSDVATVAYRSSTGARLWAARYNWGPSEASGLSLRLSPDGTQVFVTGSKFRATSGFDYLTVAYEAATGAKRWVARYNGRGNGDDLVNSLGVSPDGTEVFVTGTSQGSATTASDFATVAFNATNGARLWVARYNGPGASSDEAFSLGVSPDGARVFITGGSTGSGSGSEYATVVYTTS